MARFLYTLLFYSIQPLVWLRLYWRSLKAPAYRNRLRERYGSYTHIAKPEGPCLWVHAVSVGETIASVPLIKRLKSDYPSLQVVVTTMTPTGAEQVEKQLGHLVTHAYAPYDLPGAVKGFLQYFQPQALVIMETELWPNTIALCHKAGVPAVLANGRLSEKSARGYGRFKPLVKEMLNNLDLACIQTEIEARRFNDLGMESSRIQVTGSVKFDVALSETDRERAQVWRSSWSQGVRKIWIAASTHDGEETMLLAAHRKLLGEFPSLLLVLVPRHPERFEPVFKLCEDSQFETRRLSSGEPIGDGCQVLVGDTMGDLLALYGTADIAFVGGSLIERGGHNLLEPALWSLPVLSGPYVFNFLEIAERLAEAGGLLTASDESALVSCLGNWLQDESMRLAAGEKAYAVVEANRGALDKLEAVVVDRLGL